MNIKVIEEENRLHLVFEGLPASTEEAIKSFIKTIAGADVPTEMIDDFEPVDTMSPDEESKVIEEANRIKANEPESQAPSEEDLVNDYLNLFRKDRERFYYSSISNFSSKDEINKKAYTKAFKIWVKEYFSSDPYLEKDKEYQNLKNHRGFFKVFAKMLPEEISAAEKQLGYEAGKFADYASNEEIMTVFEQCRTSLLERAN